VRQDGVEGALHSLFRHGVYLTVDEFKGRQPVVRGSTTMAMDPGQLRNPWSAIHAPVRSSGSRGPGNEFSIDLAFVREHAVNMNLVLNARGALIGYMVFGESLEARRCFSTSVTAPRGVPLLVGSRKWTRPRQPFILATAGAQAPFAGGVS